MHGKLICGMYERVQAGVQAVVQAGVQAVVPCRSLAAHAPNTPHGHVCQTHRNEHVTIVPPSIGACA
jgi:hypothetical protein